MPHTAQNPDVLLSELDEGAILRLTLNDVGRRNALSESMLTRLGIALAKGQPVTLECAGDSKVERAVSG